MFEDLTFTLAPGNGKIVVNNMTATDAVSFDIEYREVTAENFTQLYAVTGLQEISALNMNLYEVRVRARGVSGVGDFSNVRSVIPFSLSDINSTTTAVTLQTLGAASLAFVPAATLVTLPISAVQEAAQSSSFATSFDNYLETFISSLYASPNTNNTPTQNKQITDKLLRFRAAIAIGSVTPITPTHINNIIPEQLGTALSNINIPTSARYTVVPIPMSPPLPSGYAAVVTLTAEQFKSELYFAGQAGDKVRVQLDSDSTKYMIAEVNNSGILRIDSTNVTSGSQIINTQFGSYVKTIDGSAVLTLLPQMDVVCINTSAGVQIKLLFNSGYVDYSAIGSIKIQTLTTGDTDISYNEGAIQSVTIPSGAGSVETTIVGLNTSNNYKFVAWLEDAAGNKGPKAASQLAKWVANSNTPLLSINHIARVGTSELQVYVSSINDASLNNVDAVADITGMRNTSRTASPHYDKNILITGVPAIGALMSYFTLTYSGLQPGTLYDLYFTQGGVNYYIRSCTLGSPCIIICDSYLSSPDEYSVTLAPSNTDLQSPTYTTEVTVYAQGGTGLYNGTFDYQGSARYYLSTYVHGYLAGNHEYTAVYSADGYNIATLSFNTYSAAVCFLADAPVLTPAGYTRISEIKEGDLVRTAAGRDVSVKRVFAKEYQAGASVNPFVIPKGSFGALRALPISPNHEVMVSGCGMVKAKDLGLPRMKMTGLFTYYNLELEDWTRDNLMVAGVECESLAPAKRITMTKAEFGQFVKARYGPAAAARLKTVCFEQADGSVSMPAL